MHFSHVIEHIADVNGFLSEVHRITRPGGRVVVVTPNRASIQAAIAGPQWRSAIADHTHLFSAAGLTRVLESAGFRVISRKTWGGIPVGMAPVILKKAVDRVARLSGLGDVVMCLAVRD